MPVAHFHISASLAYRAGTTLLPLPLHSTHRGTLPRLFHLASGLSTRLPTLQTRSHFGSTSIPPPLPLIPAPTIMFKQAVRNHSTTTPAPVPPPASKQQSLTSSFTRPQTTPNSRVNNTSNTRPLSTLPTNASRTNTEVPSRRMSGQNHGIKRTSSGLAKALSSQEDSFGYSPISISDLENDTPPVRSAQNNTQPQNTGFSSESDYGSDVDLDIEDPALKATVKYPHHAINSSSQPIPWSSSPLDHFQPRPKVEQLAPEKSKRRTLPWLQKQSQQSQLEMEPQDEPESAPPRKRRSQESTPTAASISTPAPTKEKAKYDWNISQSAIKEKQKNLREASKSGGAKVNKATDEAKEAAITKKKATIVSKIFLSEEQTRVLNLVTEHKKSVFFTGSAGTCFLYAIELSFQV